jgi:hypothetical protein
MRVRNRRRWWVTATCCVLVGCSDRTSDENVAELADELSSAELQGKCGAISTELVWKTRYLDTDDDRNVVTRAFDGDSTQRWCFHTTNPTSADPLPSWAGAPNLPLFTIRQKTLRPARALDAGEDGNNFAVVRAHVADDVSQRWQVRSTSVQDEFTLVQFSTGAFLTATSANDFRVEAPSATIPSTWRIHLE